MGHQGLISRDGAIKEVVSLQLQFSMGFTIFSWNSFGWEDWGPLINEQCGHSLRILRVPSFVLSFFPSSCGLLASICVCVYVLLSERDTGS